MGGVGTRAARIVIDVLRTSSTIVAAFHSGARAVKPVIHPLEGLELGKDGYITVGEYRGRKLPGYDFHNSPSQLMGRDLSGKRIALCTTNGSFALISSGEAYIGCFMNASYVAELDATPYPVGRLGKPAIEDDLCAHAILAERHGLTVDYARIEEMITGEFENYVEREDREIPHEDLELCLSFNEYNILPYYNGREVLPSNSK